MIRNTSANLLNSKGLSHKKLIDKYKAILDTVIKIEDANQRADELRDFVDLLIIESVGLGISRQLFGDLCAMLANLSIEEAKTIANYSPENIQPRAISFEDQVTSFRQLMSEIYENELYWKKAANMLSGIPLETTNIEEEAKQLQNWKRYISWEKKNPLKLKSEDLIKKRVMFAYEQSFSSLGYHCDIWYEAANYLYKHSRLYATTDSDTKSKAQIEIENETSYLYERSINTFMTNNLLIHLVYADFEELRGNFQRCYELYEKCLQNTQIEATLTWIHYIRFVRRHEDINAARRLFKRAREDPRSTYHLFIANAYLEYFSTKDKAIGFKIFQLGTKKFANIPEYMLAYIKYMSHLNEDNNTRVLFERILSSDELPMQNTNEIWSEFLKFECAVGDLASILKVDKKRQKVFESIQSTEINECTLMVDRYKYFDLLPCNQNELKAIGYKDIPVKIPSISTGQQNLYSNNSICSPTEFTFSAVNELKKSKYPSPDPSQMLPYKPVRNGLPVLHSIAGGVFPFPPSVTELVKRLPPPSTFEGPFVKIDELMKLFQQIEISEDFQPLYVYLNGEPMRELEHLNILAGNLNSNTGSQQTQANKRSILNANSDDEDSKKTKTAELDIYKQRQLKKYIDKK